MPSVCFQAPIPNSGPCQHLPVTFIPQGGRLDWTKMEARLHSRGEVLQGLTTPSTIVMRALNMLVTSPFSASCECRTGS